MRGRRLAAVALAAGLAVAAAGCAGPPVGAGGPPIVVGSKAFTESVVLGEVIATLARSAGAATEHRSQLGGTRVVYNALRAGEIDIYAEYTGTIAEEILGGGALDDEAMREALARQGITMSRPLGFDNTYVIGMRDEVAERLGIERISDLRTHPGLRFGFSNELMDRADGWPGLRARYGLPQSDVRGLDHDLAYRGIESGAIDAIDLYSTDAEIAFYGLRSLRDDLGYFPDYRAVLLFSDALGERAPGALAAILRLEEAIPGEEMIAMNARAKLERVPEQRVAADFLAAHFGLQEEVAIEGPWQRFRRNLAGHLWLVSASLFAAVLLAVPLGIVAARRQIGRAHV